ncbi:hypothetical protein [Homoserinibacter sp. YIM 151385]|uniref:hypothetical protein n=1 Tax=Homoserinibacter sp. YIM 151385 TaxID=2985506 RepID=UPI0022F112F5|nr:hypothetical protein [Homoserinibacter sp. YIM 151385]WBU37529.1 hypothetical protein OF852_11475 [Homoserinibacter sp. YIM 151385]
MLATAVKTGEIVMETSSISPVGLGRLSPATWVWLAMMAFGGVVAAVVAVIERSRHDREDPDD